MPLEHCLKASFTLMVLLPGGTLLKPGELEERRERERVPFTAAALNLSPPALYPFEP
jgi:hypothetical protein